MRPQVRVFLKSQLMAPYASTRDQLSSKTRTLPFRSLACCVHGSCA